MLDPIIVNDVGQDSSTDQHPHGLIRTPFH